MKSANQGLSADMLIYIKAQVQYVGRVLTRVTRERSRFAIIASNADLFERRRTPSDCASGTPKTA